MYRINNNGFIILTKFKSFINELDDYLENVPRKDKYYKDKTRNIILNILENVFLISYFEDIPDIKSRYYIIKKDINLLDFMLERFYEKKYISEKCLEKLGSLLIQINKMITSWIENMVKNAS